MIIGKIALQKLTRFGGRIFPLNCRNASTLIYVESLGDSYLPSTLSAVSAAKVLGGPVSCLVIGSNSRKVSEDVSKITGVDKVYYKESEKLNKATPETLTPLVVDFVKKQNGLTHLISVSSSVSKSLLPRVASKLDIAPLTDVIEIHDENTFSRPIYAGNAISKVKHTQDLKIMTVRATAFPPISATGGSASVEACTSSSDQQPDFSVSENSKWVHENISKSELPDLADAKIVLAGGRAFKSKEGFDILYGLAKKLNAAVGASRAAVDSGFCSNDLQIGQTGKIVAPQLYIGFGISGAIQHVAGMKDSKVIVNVNTDSECPLSEIADFSLTADIFKVIPEMESKIKSVN